ncbi:phage tail fiber protein [Paenibacillus macerans]|uniref:phage tail fiber protein n=1 Tax=Paenibacillus macerans TaxID=44252 RepID=UPI003D31AD11
MAMQISNWLSEQFLNAVLRGIPYTPPDQIFLALYTSDPTPANTGTEVAEGGYERQIIQFGAPTLVSGKQKSVTIIDVEFNIATADWGLVTHTGLLDAPTGGHLLWSKSLGDEARTVLSGDKPKFLAGSSSVAFAQ